MLGFAEIRALGRRFFFPIPTEVAQGQERLRVELEITVLDDWLETVHSARTSSLRREEQFPRAP